MRKEGNRKVSDSVEQERDRLSALINSITDEVWFADTQKKFTLANPTALKQFSDKKGWVERNVEKLAGSLEVYRPDGSLRPVEEAPPLRALKGELVKNQEEIVRIPSTGEMRYRQVNASPVRNAKGDIIGAVSVVRDVTESKKAEKEIAWLASFPELNPNPIVEVDFEGTIHYVNRATKKLFPDLKAKGLNHPLLRDWEHVVKAFRDEKKSTFGRDEKIRNHWYRQAFYAAQNQRVRIYTIDIDERKLVEEALRESEQRWAITLSSIVDAVIATDLDGRITFMNRVAEELTGWTLAEATQKPANEVFNIINEHTRKRMEGPVAKVLEKGVIVGLANHTILVRKDNSEVPIDDSGAPIKDKSNKTTGVVLVFRDITESKKAEEKLIASEKFRVTSMYVRSLIEASLDPLVTINAKGKITDVNTATELATGCSRKQLIGSDFSDYFTEPAKARQGYREVFAKGFVKDYPLAIRHGSGRIVDVLYNATLFRDEAGTIQGVFAAARDVTELRKAEEQAQENANKLKDAERLATIGQTAGMVGHDIRNPLQAVVGELYLAKSEMSSMPEGAAKDNMNESLRAIEENIDYISKIVGDLQDFAKPLSPLVEESNLESIIHDLLLYNKVSGSIQVDSEIGVDAKIVMADSSFLKRIIGNLISNAVQAMPNGGKLSICVSREGDDAVITVEDTGEGIPEEVRAKLFKPLFTTKSKGQGFGLAVVKRLVEALNGTVTYESKVGKGTKFIVRFPSVQNRKE